MTYSIIEKFRHLMFSDSFSTITELELTTDDEIILDNQLFPSEHLKQLTISLKNVNDLYVLFGNLVPNLIVLNVTLCQSNAYKGSSLPPF